MATALRADSIYRFLKREPRVNCNSFDVQQADVRATGKLERETKREREKKNKTEGRFHGTPEKITKPNPVPPVWHTEGRSRGFRAYANWWRV